MNKVNAKLATSIFFLIVAILLLCSTMTLAWFTVNVTDNIEVKIPADSVRMLKFDSPSIVDEINVLRPAVEKVDGIANNVDYSFDLTVTNEELLNETATEVMIKAPLQVYILPTDERMTIVISLSVTLRNGNVEYEIIGDDVLELLKFEFCEFKDGSYENVPLTPDHQYEKILDTKSETESFNSGDKFDIYVKVSLAQPQGLLDPILADPNTVLQVNINARMVLPSGEAVVQNEGNNITLVIPTVVEESH